MVPWPTSKKLSVQVRKQENDLRVSPERDTPYRVVTSDSSVSSHEGGWREEMPLTWAWEDEPAWPGDKGRESFQAEKEATCYRAENWVLDSVSCVHLPKGVGLSLKCSGLVLSLVSKHNQVIIIIIFLIF